jgi:hypothetical protein
MKLVNGIWSTNTTPRALGTEIVTIYVGPKRKVFKIHKKLLCDQSDYFSKAFNGRFQEANGEMYCPEDHPTAFSYFVNYVYWNVLPKSPQRSAADKKKEEYYDGLSNLFFLAEKLCMNELSNKVMDTIQDHYRVHGLVATCAGLESVYRHTHQNSKFRIYDLLSYMRCQLNQRSTEEDITEVKDMLLQVPEIAKDFVLFQVKHAVPWKANKLLDPKTRGATGYGKCFFHTHATGERCHLETS